MTLNRGVIQVHERPLSAAELEARDPLVRWQKMRPRPEPQPREPKLDIRPPTLAEIDHLIGQRIDAERSLMIDAVGAAMGEILAQLRKEIEAATVKLRSEFDVVPPSAGLFS
jgi:hypothetical protein